jgi:hypothetical protein
MYIGKLSNVVIEKKKKIITVFLYSCRHYSSSSSDSSKETLSAQVSLHVSSEKVSLEVAAQDSESEIVFLLICVFFIKEMVESMKQHDVNLFFK